jgi:FtsZ-binding cell division protein ZapB
MDHLELKKYRALLKNNTHASRTNRLYDMTSPEEIKALNNVIDNLTFLIESLQIENKALKMENEVLKDNSKGKQGRLRLLYPQVEKEV